MSPDAEEVPPGVPSPILNPDHNEGPTILGSLITVNLFAIIVVLTRAYVRGFMIRNLGWDVRSSPGLRDIGWLTV